jgi:thiol:disulfide interchange protein
MKPTKETVAVVLDGLFAIILWVASWYIPEAVVTVLWAIWGVVSTIVVALLVRWLKIELRLYVDRQIAALRVSLRIK